MCNTHSRRGEEARADGDEHAYGNTRRDYFTALAPRRRAFRAATERAADEMPTADAGSRELCAFSPFSSPRLRVAATLARRSPRVSREATHLSSPSFLAAE